jgi:antitoxin component HigA of HigAB toxin-antitoxin module
MIQVDEHYKQLLSQFPLAPIVDAEDLRKANQLAARLYRSFGDLPKSQRAFLQVLSMLIESYENELFGSSFPKSSPCEALNYLLKENGLKQADLAKILAVGSGRASELVNGERELSKNQILILAQWFKVNPTLFMPLVVMPGGNAASAKYVANGDKPRGTLTKGVVANGTESYRPAIKKAVEKAAVKQGKGSRGRKAK